MKTHLLFSLSFILIILNFSSSLNAQETNKGHPIVKIHVDKNGKATIVEDYGLNSLRIFPDEYNVKIHDGKIAENKDKYSSTIYKEDKDIHENGESQEINKIAISASFKQQPEKKQQKETGKSQNVKNLEKSQDMKLDKENSITKTKDNTNKLSSPNLTIYTGTGSDNTYTFHSTTNVLDVNTSVQNNGSAAAGSFKIGFYLSTNTIISTTDNLIATTTKTSLASGYYSNQSISVDLDGISQLSSGDYYVGIYFDYQSSVSESNETDNDFYYTPTINYGASEKPNLKIYTGTGSDNTYNYNSTTHVLDVNTSVLNDGDGAAGSFRIGFYLSTNTIISTTDNLIATATKTSLASGYYSNKSISVDLDDVGEISTGSYYVGVFFDDEYTVSETDETDNDVYYTPTINYDAPENANLTIYTGTGSDNTYNYNSSTHILDVNTSVLNDGDGAAGSFRIGFYLSTNTIIATTDNLIATATKTSLASGYYSNKSISIDLDDVGGISTGAYYVGIYFDDEYSVSETDETDNNFYYTPTINFDAPERSNLTIYTETGSDNTYTFHSSTNVLDVNTSVQNNGTVDADNFRIGFYLSTNTSISTTDNLIAIATVTSLSSGYYANKSISVDLDGIPEFYSGEYYVGIFIDDEFAVTENNEDDNAIYFTPTINVSTGIENYTSSLFHLNSLKQNYPNPFTNETNITYSVSEKSLVVLNIYNIGGELIQTLVNENKLPGSYSVKWNVSNLAAGIYVYQIKANDFSDMKRCIVVK
ncbi:MAG: T9SS type A sorting domain-containing protein [Bacteroidales bacterium]|nr:T9SS type A sorting domain-containing protein [Bacteroidales bacterium]